MLILNAAMLDLGAATFADLVAEFVIWGFDVTAQDQATGRQQYE